MSKVFLTTVVVSFFSSLISPAAFSDVYLCVAQSSTGFKADRNWEQTTFKVDDMKYIVRSVKKGEEDVLGKPLRSPYLINEVGADFLDDDLNGCQFNRSETLLFCDYVGTSITVNLRDLLFQSSDRAGYTLQKDKNFASDVFITIGKCSKIG